MSTRFETCSVHRCALQLKTRTPLELSLENGLQRLNDVNRTIEIL